MTPLRFLGGLGLGLGLVFSAGCMASRDRAPVSALTPVAGDVRTGQAVWCPRRSMPELAGELIVINPPGPDFLVRFSKDPLCLAQAERQGGRWRVEFAAGTRHRQGRGRLPQWTAWFVLTEALDGATLPKPWTGQVRSTGEFRLSNPRTGESLEGFLTP
ncbi:MAG: hypothetical protein JNK85_10300 [Verrucomicrobiales bacterium]|nr:hypothetical protein [Verrucomicrobiales bacterium]